MRNQAKVKLNTSLDGESTLPKNTIMICLDLGIRIKLQSTLFGNLKRQQTLIDEPIAQNSFKC